MSDSNEVLAFNDVSVIRSGRAILSHLSWSVKEGENWVIFGPNGAGKSTTVSLASARMHPSMGTVDIVGEHLGRVDVAELRPLVGVASPYIDHLVEPGARVLDVVRTAAWGQTARWREEYEDEDTARAYSLLARYGVDYVADRTFGTLSSGEVKRVGIARAMMSDPEILILDEPTSGLDLGGRESLMNLLDHQARTPYSPVMVLVTHHVEEIPSAFSHALLLDKGHMVACGEKEAVLNSENLSRIFSLNIRVTHSQGRLSAVADVN